MNPPNHYLKFCYPLKSKHWIFLLVFIAMVHGQLNAQSDSTRSKPSFWLHGGLDISLAGADPETSAGGGNMARAGIGFQISKVVLSVRYTQNTGGKSQQRGFFGGFRRDNFTEIAIMGGVEVLPKEKSRFVISGGISRIQASLVGRYGLDPILGFPLEIGWIGGDWELARIGIYLHTNFQYRSQLLGLSPLWKYRQDSLLKMDSQDVFNENIIKQDFTYFDAKSKAYETTATFLYTTYQL